MIKTENIQLVVERLSSLYDLTLDDKNILFHKISALSDEDFQKIVLSLSDFLNQYKNSIKKLKTKLQTTSIKIEELQEQKDFSNKDNDFFNNI